MLYVFDRRIEDTLDGFRRVEGKVRRHDDAWMVDEIVILKDSFELLFARVRCGEKCRLISEMTFFFKYVESCACNLFASESLNKGLSFDDGSSGGVDEVSTFFDTSDIISIDKVMCLFVVGNMESDDIERSE